MDTHSKWVYYNTHYFGRSIDEFVGILVSHSVKTLVDTRSTPTSRRVEFSAQNLSRTLREHSICYVGAPQLGCPKTLRLRAWRSGDYGPLWDWYTKNVLTEEFWVFMRELVDNPKPFAFMCVENNPALCHRHLIAETLARRGCTVIEI
ncbi:MAG: DUF488 domain-containing protein [Thermoprotei archaeon]